MRTAEMERQLLAAAPVGTPNLAQRLNINVF